MHRASSGWIQADVYMIGMRQQLESGRWLIKEGRQVLLKRRRGITVSVAGLTVWRQCCQLSSLYDQKRVQIEIFHEVLKIMIFYLMKIHEIIGQIISKTEELKLKFQLLQATCAWTSCTCRLLDLCQLWKPRCLFCKTWSAWCWRSGSRI